MNWGINVELFTIPFFVFRQKPKKLMISKVSKLPSRTKLTPTADRCYLKRFSTCHQLRWKQLNTPAA